MATDAQRNSALNDIRENIARSGQHVYVVTARTTPRFAYSIGVSESIGAELILAGAIYYSNEEAGRIVKDIAAQLRVSSGRTVCDVSQLGSFTLQRVHSSWARNLILGAYDYYQKDEIAAFQIIPDEAHWTIDVPEMSVPWSPSTPWRWLREPWSYPVPEDATAITDLDALRGERITEVTRWEEDEWEMFAGAGPDKPKEELRIVPLGTLLASDDSLVPVTRMGIGEGLWRDGSSDWHVWEDSSSKSSE